MPETVYMPLLDEGTDVWRPVEAYRLSERLHIVLGVMPDDETWAFPPGSEVRCELRHFRGEPDRLVAVALAN
jgi:hypothetical protein